MQNVRVPASKELQDIDIALRRAAQTAKKLAEQNGIPYVVAETKSNEQLHHDNDASKQ